MKFNTKCVHGSGKPDSTGAISPAIYMSSTFSHPKLGDTTCYQYSRESNPTRDRLEQLIAGLEEGTDALAFSSGMAAVDAVFQLFSPGDHIILGDDLYGGSIRMFTNIYEQNGIEFTYVGTSDLDAVKAAFKPNTKAVYIETPTNPMMEITDIRALCALAHERNALVIIDNTFLSPYFQKPLTLGADIVVHSGTKFIGGHHDVISGFTIVKDDELAAKLRLTYKTVGACYLQWIVGSLSAASKHWPFVWSNTKRMPLLLRNGSKYNLRLLKYCSQVFQNIQAMKSIKPKRLALVACCPLK